MLATGVSPWKYRRKTESRRDDTTSRNLLPLCRPYGTEALSPMSRGSRPWLRVVPPPRGCFDITASKAGLNRATPALNKTCQTRSGQKKSPPMRRIIFALTFVAPVLLGQTAERHFQFSTSSFTLTPPSEGPPENVAFRF